jgi:5-methylcytosine-specific restriction enzyme subunit McrC
MPDFNPRNCRSPDPRPDFVVKHNSGASAILDAKYRNLWEQSLPRDMLYQLAIYASSHDSKVATILYPTTDGQAKEARVEVRDPVLHRQIAQVRLRPVDLARIEDLALAKPTAAVRRQRAVYAAWMVFGRAPMSG